MSHHLAIGTCIPLLVASVAIQICVACLCCCVGVVHVLSADFIDTKTFPVEVGVDEGAHEDGKCGEDD